MSDDTIPNSSSTGTETLTPKRRRGRMSFAEKYPGTLTLLEQQKIKQDIKLKAKLEKAVKEVSMDEIRDLVRKNPLEDPDLVLTGLQKRFLQCFVSNNGVISKALDESGYSANFNSVKSLIESAAGKLYIEKILEGQRNSAELTVQEVVNKSRKLFDAAMNDGDFKAAMSAVEFMGKYLGMQVDRSEHVQKNLSWVSGNDSKAIQKDIKHYQNILKTVVTPDLIKAITPTLIENSTQNVEQKRDLYTDYDEMSKPNVAKLENLVNRPITIDATVAETTIGERS